MKHKDQCLILEIFERKGNRVFELMSNNEKHVIYVKYIFLNLKINLNILKCS